MSQATSTTRADGAEPHRFSQGDLQIHTAYGDGMADAAEVLGEVRAELRGRKTPATPEAWQDAMDEELLELVGAGRTEEAKARLLDALAPGAAPTS